MSWSSVASGLSPDSWWRMGEASGNLSDSGSGGKTLTKGATGGTYGASSLIFNDTSNKAISLPGGDSSGNYGFTGGDYYDFAGTAAFTIVAFVKPDGSGSGTTRRILEKLNTNGWRVAHSSADKVLFQRITSAGTTTYVSTGSLASGVTKMVVCRYDGTNMAVFLDAVKDATGDVASSFSMDNTTGVVSLGCTSSNLGTFGGTLDEVMVFSSALTDAQIVSLYEAAQQQTKTFTTNAVIADRLTKTFTTDAVISASVPKTFTTDAVVKPVQGTLYGSGTHATVACGSDIYGDGVMVFVTDSDVDGVKLERSADGGTTWADLSSTSMAATNLGSGNWKVVDQRPQYGSQSIAYGGTALYRVSAKAGTIVGPASSSVSITSTQDRAAAKLLLYSNSHSHISAQTDALVAGAVPTHHYTTYGELQIGQWLMAMADAYRNTANSAYLTDCQNQWDYMKAQVSTYGGGKFMTLATEGSVTQPTYSFITMDGHFRPILHALMAARLIALVNPSASIISDIRSYCDTWLKNAWDYFKNESGGGSPTYTWTWAGWDADNQTAIQRDHDYAVGDLVRPTTPNGHSFRCKVAGRTAVGAVTLSTTAGAETTDGTAVFKETSRTVTKFKYQYYNATAVGAPYPTVFANTFTDWRAQDSDATDVGATIINKELCVAAALALALQDCSSFTAAGTVRTRALDYVAGVTDWICSVFSLSDGGFPYAVYAGSTGKATVYQGFNASLLAIISKLGYDTSNSWQTRPVVQKALDFMENTGIGLTEPYQRIWVDSTTQQLQGISELGFCRAAYTLLGRTNPYDNATFSSAFIDPGTGMQGYPYSPTGGAPPISSTRTGAIYSILDQFATIDSILTTERAFSTDAVITSSRTKTFTTDAQVKQTVSATFTTDAAIRSAFATTWTRTFTTDARVIDLGVTRTLTTDARIVTGASPPVTTATRPFYAPLDVVSVTAPLDVAAVTAPLDMTTEV